MSSAKQKKKKRNLGAACKKGSAQGLGCNLEGLRKYGDAVGPWQRKNDLTVLRKSGQTGLEPAQGTACNVHTTLETLELNATVRQTAGLPESTAKN